MDLQFLTANRTTADYNETSSQDIPMASTATPSYFPTSFPSNANDNDQSINLKNEALIVASFSILLYGFAFIVSLYYYIKFVKLERLNLLTQQQEEEDLRGSYSSNNNRYDHAKKLFFGILALSSFLEIPSYLGCLVNNGPTDCEWRGFDEIFFWFFHLIALCGYACCIVIPCVLWSDMINKKDGKLFFSTYPYDHIKRYFQGILLLYFLNNVILIVVSLAYWRESDRLYYQDAPTYSICPLIECILIVLLSTGCLFCGIQLEIYVHEAKLNPTVEMKFLFTLNIVLGVIVLSFLGRAILVLRFAPGMSEALFPQPNYAVFILIARWTPDIFCQLLLVLIMKSSGNEVAAKKTNKLLSFSGKSQSNKPLLSDDYNADLGEASLLGSSLNFDFNIQSHRYNSESYEFKREAFKSVTSEGEDRPIFDKKYGQTATSSLANSISSPKSGHANIYLIDSVAEGDYSFVSSPQRE